MTDLVKIEFCIDKWIMGVKNTVAQFKGKEYAAKYYANLNKIKELKLHSMDAERRLLKMLKSMYDKGWYVFTLSLFDDFSLFTL